MYKTYVPIKQTSHTMALAICELTALLTGMFTDKFRGLDPTTYHTERLAVTETMLDILDLYENQQNGSEFARQFPPDTFIELKIEINRELEEKDLPRYMYQCAACERDVDTVASDSDDPDFLRAAAAAARPGDVPTRYVFDTDAAAAELLAVRRYFVDEFEEVEYEEEEEIPNSPPSHPPAHHRDQQPRGPRGPRGGGGGGRGRRGGGPGGPPRGPGGGPPRGPAGPNGPPRDGGGRDHGGAGGRGNWRSRNRHGNRRRRD